MSSTASDDTARKASAHIRAASRRSMKAVQNLRIPNGRTWQGRRLREFRASLFEHVGGKPSAVQIAIIDRCTTLKFHLDGMDDRVLKEGELLSEHDCRRYAAWSNGLVRALRTLGLNPKPEAPSRIADPYGNRHRGAAIAAIIG